VPPNSPAARYMASDRRPLVARIITMVVILGALLFAVQGGEFGTLDLVRQRRTEARLTHEIDSLRHVVDTLAAEPPVHRTMALPKNHRRVAQLLRGQTAIGFTKLSMALMRDFTKFMVVGHIASFRSNVKIGKLSYMQFGEGGAISCSPLYLKRNPL